MSRFEELVQVWDHLPAHEAVARAWMTPRPSAGTWHQRARADVEYCMPLLARALDRLLLEHADVLPSADWRLWEWPEGTHPNDVVRVDQLRTKVRGRR